MIGWLASIIVSRFPAVALERARRLAIVGLVVLLVLGLVGVGCALKRTYDADVVDRARIEDNAQAVGDKAAADEKAGESRQDDALRAQAEQREIEKVISDAPNPDDARRAYYRCVRLQQDARAAGRPASPCV